MCTQSLDARKKKKKDSSSNKILGFGGQTDSNVRMCTQDANVYIVFVLPE